MAKKNNAAKSKKAAPVMLSKKTMNFVHHVSSFSFKKVLPVILLILLAVGSFVKFGVLDLMDDKVHAYNVLAYKQNELAAINIKLTGYETLEKEYGRYSYGWMDEKEINTVPRMEVLKLVEQKIAPTARIFNLSVKDNTLRIDITGLTLEQVSTLVTSLEVSPMVESTTLHNVVADTASEATVSMTIILTKEVAE